MYTRFIRSLNILQVLVLVGMLAACASTNTGSDASQSSSIQTPQAEQTESAAQAPAETPPESEAGAADMTSAVEPVEDMAVDKSAAPDTGVADEVATGSAAQRAVVEPIAEFPEQPYAIDDEDGADSAQTVEIKRLREELTQTESELQRMQEEQAQRDYSVAAETTRSAEAPAAADEASSAYDEGTVADATAAQTTDEPPAHMTTGQASDVPQPQARDYPGKPAEFSVYFDFDQSVFDGRYEAVVVAHADYLKANPALKVEIQGNCDERGSREYNIALGQRRAQTVKRALELLGVDGSRISAISFGSEKPIAFGHDEESWRLNRRADIVY